MRVVVDPNVFVSALISPAGPPAQVVRAWSEERYELIVSPALLAELEDVLLRPRFRRWFSEADAEVFAAGLAADATVVDDPSEPDPISSDQDDDYLVALVRASSADFLISGDPDLTDLEDPSPPVLTPRQFADRLADDARG